MLAKQQRGHMQVGTSDGSFERYVATAIENGDALVRALLHTAQVTCVPNYRR